MLHKFLKLGKGFHLAFGPGSSVTHLAEKSSDHLPTAQGNTMRHATAKETRVDTIARVVRPMMGIEVLCRNVYN